MFLWRISNYATLDGIGGKLFPARWHSDAQPIIYTADHPASSLCEMLANTDAGNLPSTFQLLKISAKYSDQSEAVDLPTNWVENRRLTQAIGNRWLRNSSSAILRVPSAIIPEAFNYLINPRHLAKAHIRIERVIAVALDSRLK
jgi:RES domain-containing protein